MSLEIKVPTLGESITEASVVKWLKKEGESFEIDEALVEIETDKITLEVSAPSAGTLEKIQAKEGNDVKVGGVLGLIKESSSQSINKKIKTQENIIDDMPESGELRISTTTMISSFNTNINLNFTYYILFRK